ncbi:MAG: AI-2E family transporter [Clostridiaceae bacterium]|nr:AI-2E family transporter [Clostridiaceae bacterium]
MADLDRIQKDKATILAIIKYLLIAGLTAAAVLFGFRLFLILLPFVFGFILAKVSISIVTSLNSKSFARRQRHNQRLAEKAAAGVPAGSETKEKPDSGAAASGKAGHYPQGLARSRRDNILILVVYILIIIAVTALIIGVIVVGISQLRALVNYLPNLIRDTDLSQRLVTYLSDLSDRLGGFLQPDQLTFLKNEIANLQQKLLASVPGLVTTVLNGIGSFAASLPTVFFVIIVVIMSGYYFITDSRNLYKFLRRNGTSKVFREKTIRLVNTLSTTLFRVIGGYLLLLILTFIMALIGLLIIRMPYAVVFALIAAIVDFLPVLGLSATLIPISIYMFINGNILSGVGALVILAIMTMIRRVIEPAILGSAMRLHPMATLASMIVGIAIYGITGLVIGPIILVIAKEVLPLYGLDRKLRNIIGDILNKVSS